MQRLLLEKLDRELLDKASKVQKKLLALKGAANSIQQTFISTACERGQRLLQVAVRKRIPDLISEVDKFTSTIASFINDLNDLMQSEAIDKGHLNQTVGQFFSYIKVGRKALDNYDTDLGRKEIRKAIDIILDKNERKIISKISDQKEDVFLKDLIEEIEDTTIEQLMALPASLQGSGGDAGDAAPKVPKQPENSEQPAAKGSESAKNGDAEEPDDDEDLEEGCSERDVAKTIFDVLNAKRLRKGKKNLGAISFKLASRLIGSKPSNYGDIEEFFMSLKLAKNTKQELSDAVKDCFQEGEPPEEATAPPVAEEPATQFTSGDQSSAESPASGGEESDDEWVNRVANLIVNNQDYEEDVKKKLKQLGYTPGNLNDVWKTSKDDVLHKLFAKLNVLDGKRFDRDSNVDFLSSLVENLRKRHGAVLVERWQRLAGIR